MKDQKGYENEVADHLSLLESNHENLVEIETDNTFPDEIVISLSWSTTPWYEDYFNFIMSNLLVNDLNIYQKKMFLFDVKNYFWDDQYFW